jgi:hypothetical protein
MMIKGFLISLVAVLAANAASPADAGAAPCLTCEDDPPFPDEPPPPQQPPSCGPFSRAASHSMGFSGEILSASLSALASVEGSQSGVRDAMGFRIDGTVFGQPLNLVDMATSGFADGASASGDGLISLAGFAILPHTTTTGGTVERWQPLLTWTLWSLSGQTPPVCDPLLGVLCARAQGTIQLAANVGFGLRQTVAPSSVLGHMGPFGSLTGTVVGSACIGLTGACTILGINVQLSGTAVIANLSVGAQASAALTSPTAATSSLGVGANFEMGNGSIDLAFQTCAVGLCSTVWSQNVANWAPPVSHAWGVPEDARTHCL